MAAELECLMMRHAALTLECNERLRIKEKFRMGLWVAEQVGHAGDSNDIGKNERGSGQRRL